MKGETASLVPIAKALKLQLNELNHDTAYKVLGLITFVMALAGPYYLIDKYWWMVEGLASDPGYMSFFSIYLWTTFLMFALNGFFGVLYWLNHPAIEKYKDNDVPWPWETEDDWKPKIWKAIWVNIFNHCILTGILSFGGVYMESLSYVVTIEDLPSFPVFVCQVIFLMLVEDCVFFWCHRALHQPWIYPYIHKMHHEFYNCITLTSEYAHPVEYFFANSFPSFVGSNLLFGKCHLLAMLVYLTLKMFETNEAHCGYDFPYSFTKHFPFSCTPHYHNHHHMFNIGNYGSFFMVWDSICGTNTHFYNDSNNYERTVEHRKQKTQ